MKFKKSKILCLMLIFSSLLLAAASVFAADSDPSWHSGKLVREGYGAAPANSISSGQAKILARRAAIVDAYRNLGEYIQGVQIDSETTVKDLTISSDIIQTRVSAIIKGAKIIAEHSNNDGSYSVTIEVPLYGETNSLASAVLPVWQNPVTFPRPAIASDDIDFSAYKTVGNYTGLIVDCRGLGLQPVMSPVIKNSNNEPIYGYKNLDYTNVIKKGMAGYSSAEHHNLTRAGSNPLIVKAISLDNHNSNPILSMSDANKILLENQASGFLTKCAVVFIK